MPRKKKPKTIKEVRVAQGLSQADFGKAIGMSTASVSAYETGRIRVGAKVAEKIKAVYGIELPVEKKGRKPRAAAKRPQTAPAVLLQSPQGQNVALADVLARLEEAETVYIRADENKVYWVRGEENGSVTLW